MLYDKRLPSLADKIKETALGGAKIKEKVKKVRGGSRPSTQKLIKGKKYGKNGK